MRLDKYLSQCTQLTRSLATTAIRQGRVRVNEKVIKSSSLKINEDTDIVLLNGQSLVDKLGHRYFMLNKPAGFVCANHDLEHQVVFELLSQEINLDRLHTVGRLDVDTTGLVLISDDGQWSHTITSPKYHQEKTYHVELAQPLTEDAQEQVENGIMLHGETRLTKPGKLENISDTHVSLSITEGRYHQVKRMFAALGNRVVGLHRHSIGELALDETLKEGEYRTLTPQEVLQLGKSS
jgi:16S rRNA pseudouridine516 synthase